MDYLDNELTHDPKSCVQLIMTGLGEKEISDLNILEEEIVAVVLKFIKEKPLVAKHLFDYIDKCNTEISQTCVNQAIIDQCQNYEKEIEIDEDSFILEANEDNWKSFEIIQNRNNNLINKANILLPFDDINDQNLPGWCVGAGITKEQREFLNSLKIQYVKWCVPIEGNYIPINKSYKLVSTMVLVDSKDKKIEQKEIVIAMASLAALVGITLGSKSK